jgi:mediator of RNA polymerase II transcription subunit 14
MYDSLTDMCTQCRGCVFAVSMHRQQLFLQAINVKRYQQQQALSAAHQQPVPGQAANLALELSQQEMSEIGDFFARRVASEPYDASRLASFVTMLTFPVPVLREFLGLIQWKKDASKVLFNFLTLPSFHAASLSLLMLGVLQL